MLSVADMRKNTIIHFCNKNVKYKKCINILGSLQSQNKMEINQIFLLVNETSKVIERYRYIVMIVHQHYVLVNIVRNDKHLENKHCIISGVFLFLYVRDSSYRYVY